MLGIPQIKGDPVIIEITSPNQLHGSSLRNMIITTAHRFGCKTIRIQEFQDQGSTLPILGTSREITALTSFVSLIIEPGYSGQTELISDCESSQYHQ